jgi:signal transduction histidine kinase
MASEPMVQIPRPRTEPGRPFPLVFSAVLLLGVGYEAILLFTPLLRPYRFPIPYAVPIFDTPFLLAGLAVGYLCLERHRLRQDFRSASLGVTLWLAALLAFAHIAAQPDYPGTPGVNPGVAPYFFFSSYLAGFAGIGLAMHYSDRQLPLSDRGRVWIGLGALCLALLIAIGVFQVRPLLPSLVMRPGRLTPFAIWLAGGSNGLVAVWIAWGARRQFSRPDGEWFNRFLLLAALIWALGLLGFLIFPFRYGISWYVAGVARPIGVGVMLVGLLREQVWLYREARARQRDLESLHASGQALVATLDPQRILDTIPAKALEVSGAEGAILFRLDAPARALRAVSQIGRVPADLASLELPVGEGVAGRAVTDRRPVWTANVEADPRLRLSAEVGQRILGAGPKGVLAIPILIEGGDPFGALSVYFADERVFAETDVELLSAFGTQVAVAIKNVQAFDQLALKARNDAALRDLSQRLLAATAEAAILDESVRAARSLLGADLAALFRFDPRDGCLHLEAGDGWQSGTVGSVSLPASADSFAGQAFLRREGVQVEDFARERRFSLPPAFLAHGIRAGFVVPVGDREQPVGVIGAYFREPHRFTEEESRVLLSLAHQTALAREKVRLYAELQANLQRLQETQAQLIQADKLTALGTLLSGMAHELNGPLTSILLSAQLLKEQHVLPAPILARVDLIGRESERASRIIKELLVFARRHAPERLRIQLNQLLQATLNLQGPEFSLKNIRVVADLAPDLPEIWADPYQLQQVFLNLLTNAAHAMSTAHGRGVLTVRSYRHGAGVAVDVQDDGRGVPAEHLGRIFDPFFTTKGAGEGTGLGLSLSFGIVESHAGRMKVENVPGSGARFTVELPIGEGVEKAEAPSPEPQPPTARAQALVVDDDPSIRSVLVDVLEVLGHRVDSATTGHEAMASLERRTYDLVTLDLRLPDVHGREVWRWLMHRDPAQAVRVVFLTGDTMSPETQAFLTEAGRPVLSKPLTIDRIRRLVDEVLRENPSGP